MADPEDEGRAISYKVLARGTPIHSADGERVGTVKRVLDNERENIFDGIVMRTEEGDRFVDAPEVARIAERRVTLTIYAAEAADLPRHRRGPPAFRADVAAGRLSRLFGGGWRRR